MASTEGPLRSNGESETSGSPIDSLPAHSRTNLLQDRHARRRPFSNWVKRLANLKSSHADSGLVQKQKNVIPLTQKYRKPSVSKNNPYLSGTLNNRADSNGLSFSTPISSQRSRHSSISHSLSKHSASISHDSAAIGQSKSRPPTLATTAETAVSDHAPSGAGTSATAARTEGDHNSTFSSPPASVRSMTTTLTTIQSAALPAAPHNPNLMGPPQTGVAPAIPAHLAPHGYPTTYHSAIANNALSDDASILTLASSSKRRRRNSVDTNASMRALAPASMFGGSRESLPLSVLSGAVVGGRERGDDGASFRDTESRVMRPGLGAERASLISASGVAAPALTSERNSYIGERSKGYGDAASVRSGLFMHGRDGSLSGSIGGLERRERRQDRDDTRSLADARSLAGVEGGMVTAPTSPLIDSPTTYQGILNVQERVDED
jgi:hypothetical protein